MNSTHRFAVSYLLILATLSLTHSYSISADPTYSHSVITPESSTSSWEESRDWLVYWNSEHAFGIRYPSEFQVASIPSTQVVRNAVVTFVPARTTFAEGVGIKTNLFEFSVTIGVTNSPVPQSQRSASSLTYRQGLEFREQHEGSLVRFTKRYSAEGAAGNRYEKFSYFMDYGNHRYEVALFVHTGNPGCYSPGSITIFDPHVLVCTLERMVRTFLLANWAHPSVLGPHLVLARAWRDPLRRFSSRARIWINGRESRGTYLTDKRNDIRGMVCVPQFETPHRQHHRTDVSFEDLLRDVRCDENGRNCPEHSRRDEHGNDLLIPALPF